MSAPWSATADIGSIEIPLPSDLEAAARKAERRQGWQASLLILPLIILIAFAFLIPVGLLLFKSVDNPVIAGGLSGTVSALETWAPADGSALRCRLPRAQDGYREGAERRHLGNDRRKAQSGLSGSAQPLAGDIPQASRRPQA